MPERKLYTSPMSQSNTITDIQALKRNRERAKSDSLFLQHAAKEETLERAQSVKKIFKSTAIVAAFPKIWADCEDSTIVIDEKEALPLPVGKYDLVIHSLGLHWSNDTVGQLIQCRRALEPDGLLLAVTLGGQTLHELRSCLAQAESTLTGGLSPRVIPMGEVRDLGGLLQRAGLALPVADTVPIKAIYKDMWHLMRDLRGMGETNAMNARLRNITRSTVINLAAELYMENYPAKQGGITATFELIVLTGWAPSENQQKPLRPGSALSRLSDALGTNEKSLSD